VHATTRLQKLFTEGFRALDIAEPLASFDADRDAGEMRRSMEAMGTSVAGLRTSGHVRGYVLAADLGSGTAADRMRPFAEGQVLTDEAGLPAAPVRSYPEAAASEHTREREMLQPPAAQRPGPGPGAEPPVAGPPAKFSRTPTRVRSAAPALGQHTDEVLTELGVSAEELQRLRNDGVV